VKPMIEMRSDTFSMPTPEMREAMAGAPLGDDVYGEDPTVRHREELAADMLGKQASCFMPSGTMANLSDPMAHAPRGGRAVVGDESDIYVYEAGGASVCGGLVYHPVGTREDGRLVTGELSEALSVDREDPQFALPAVVCLENTHNRRGGAVLPVAYLEEVRDLAAAHDVPVHLDGARVFNAADALGTTVAELCAPVDSVQFCLSKGLSAPIGSMLVGTREFVARARRVRKMLGGGMRQAGIVAAAGVVALNRMPERLAADHANAALFAEGVGAIDGLELAAPVESNIVLFRVVREGVTWREVVSAAGERGLAIDELGYGRLRGVTYSGVTRDDVERAVEILGVTLTEI